MAGRVLLEAMKPEGDDRVTRSLVVPIGTWHHPTLGVFDLNRERVTRFHDLYQQGIRQMNLPDPPAGPGGRGLLLSELHHFDGRAMGYLYDPELTADGIVASIWFSDAGLAAVRAGELNHLSPEIIPSHLDQHTGMRYRDVWNGAGLVARGFMDLPTVTVNFGDLAGLIAFGDPALPRQGAATEALQLMDEHEQIDPAQDAPANIKDETTTEAPAGEASAESADGHRIAAFADVQQRVVALETELAVERRGRFEGAVREELRTINFGDPQQPLALAPAARESLAAELAQLEPDQARRILDAVKAQRFYHPGVIGFDDPVRFDAEPEDRPLSEADRAAMRAAGLSEEQYRAGMNRAAR